MPTYNFGKFIGETLESIIPQLSDEVEVVILDGCSTDNTAEVVKSYQKHNKQIHYFREPVKGGIDKDMHLSVEKARGEYCWLFSSDDVMEKRALDRVLSEIKLGLDLYLCNYTICSFDIKTILRDPAILNLNRDRVFDLSDLAERTRYFESAIGTPAFFSFMSALVVKRSRWMETSIDPLFFGTCWAHGARIFSMIPKGLRMKYLSSSFLRLRSFNDSFLNNGYVQRVALAIDGYQTIADTIFGHESIEGFHIRRALRREFPMRLFLHAKHEIKTQQDRKTVFRLINKNFSDCRMKNLICTIGVYAIPKGVIFFLRFLYKKGQTITIRFINKKSSFVGS